jgi:hypothetical protein
METLDKQIQTIGINKKYGKQDLLKGKKLIIACPKLDETEGYVDKLAEIIRQNSLRSLTVAIMTVPCCSGLYRIVERAVALSGVPVNLEGEPLRVPPSNGRPISSASLPPLLGRGMNPRPATKGSYPLGTPDDRLPAASRGACSPLVKQAA